MPSSPFKPWYMVSAPPGYRSGILLSGQQTGQIEMIVNWSVRNMSLVARGLIQLSQWEIAWSASPKSFFISMANALELQQSCAKPPVCYIKNVDSYETKHYWFKQWLVTWSVPSHYQKPCWNIVNSNLRNKLKWNLKRNSCLFIKKYALKMSSVKCRQFCLILNVLFGGYGCGGRQLVSFQFEITFLCLSTTQIKNNLIKDKYVPGEMWVI